MIFYKSFFFFDLISRESPYLIFFWISIKRKNVLYTRAAKEEKVQGHNAQRRKETKKLSKILLLVN